MPFAIEKKRFGMKRETVRLTAETTPASWLAVDLQSEFSHVLKLLEDKALRGIKAPFPAFAGIKDTTGKIKTPLRAKNVGELFVMTFGLPSTAEQAAFIVSAGVNDKIDATEDGGAPFAATLTPGSYTSATLATEVKTQLEFSNGTAATYTVTYNATTQKFTITKNAGVFVIKWLTGANTATNAHAILGFSNTDTGSAIFQTSDSTTKAAFKHTFSLPTGIQPPTYTWFVDRDLDIKKYNGVAAKMLKFVSPVDQMIDLEADLIGLDEAVGLIGSPAYPESNPLEFYQSTNKIDGVSNVDIKNWHFDIDTGLFAKRTQSQSQLAQDVIAAARWKVSGGYTIFFENETERTKFLAATSGTLQHLLQGDVIQGTTKYTVDLNLYNSKYTAYPYGDTEGLLAATATWEAFYDPTATKMIQLDLTNDVSAY